MADFSIVLPHILKEEGGFVNHPLDPGGMTNKGITKKTYERFLGRSVTEYEMKNLTDQQAGQVYREFFWNVIKGDDLPKGIDLCIMDFAVNSGPKVAIFHVQEHYLINEKMDGILGAKTLSKLKGIPHEDREDFITDYCEARHNYLMDLPTYKTFGRGWARRVNRVREESVKLLYT